MLKQCVICETEFNATGTGLTCSPECSYRRALWRVRRWRSSNPDKLAACARSAYQRHGERIKAQRRARYRSTGR